MTDSFANANPARLFSAAAGFALMVVGLPTLLTGQQRPTELDTLRVEVVSRIDPNLPASTRSLQLISSDEIASLPVRTISELLEWAIGVDVLSRSPAQSDLSIRGAGFEQVVVLVNGIRMSDPQTGHFDLDLVVPLEMVERVEVLRGAASALYGADAMGGVVNVVTRHGEEPLSGGVQGGSWNTLHLSARGGIDRGGLGGPSVNAGAEVSRSDGHREGTDYETMLLHLSLSHSAGGGLVSGELGASRRDFGAQDFYATYPSFEKTRHYTVSLGWKSGGVGPYSWETRISARRHQDNFVLIRNDPSLYQNEHLSSQGGATVLGRYAGGRGFNVALGGEWFWDALNSSNLGDRSERRGALFGEALFGNNGAAVVTLGARADWHEGFGVFVSPSLSGSSMVLPGLRIRGALGRSFRAPTWTERYYQDPVNIGQPDLLPERAWSAEAGADASYGPRLRISTTAFLRRATSLIDWARPLSAGDTNPWETRNVEDATFRGVEADIEIDGVMGLRWTLGGMALSVHTEESAGFRSKYALRPMREQLTVGVERRIANLAYVRMRLLHGRRAGEESHRRLDLRFNLWVGAGWVHLDVLNITDFDYPDVTGARAPGRAFFVGFGTARS
ncbi:TonB-dependent receptor plug domain-containing protein [Gemmatimonadota bacterium]